MTKYALRRHRIGTKGKVDHALCVPDWAAWVYPAGQMFTMEQLPGGRLLYTPVVGEGLQPPAAAKADGRKGPKGPRPGEECGKVVDARGMKNHVAWVHRGVVPAWRKAKRR